VPAITSPRPHSSSSPPKPASVKPGAVHQGAGMTRWGPIGDANRDDDDVLNILILHQSWRPVLRPFNSGDKVAHTSPTQRYERPASATPSDCPAPSTPSPSWRSVALTRACLLAPRRSRRTRRVAGFQLPGWEEPLSPCARQRGGRWSGEKPLSSADRCRQAQRRVVPRSL